MSGVAAATFFLLAILATVITGSTIIVYYHHEIAILITCSLVLKLSGLPVLSYLDIVILGIATFLAFGRIGCFSVGCCHGCPAKKGIVYTSTHVEAGFTPYYEGVALLPVQLIESAFVFIFIITGVYSQLFRHLQPGTILILYTVVYGSFRFAIEFFRGDAERPYFKGLSEAQWTTLILVTVSMVLGYAGMLPLYKWHYVVFIVMLLGSGYIILRNNVKNAITMPAHIGQIARALYALEEKNSSITGGQNESSGPVNIFKTDMGLHLSKGRWLQQEAVVHYYTISFQHPGVLNNYVAAKIADIIRQIDKHKVSFTLREKKNGVFQILFDA